MTVIYLKNECTFPSTSWQKPEITHSMCLLPHSQNGQTDSAALWVKNKIVDILKNWVQERVDVNTVMKLPLNTR
jgi:hypothetical protein